MDTNLNLNQEQTGRIQQLNSQALSQADANEQIIDEIEDDEIIVLEGDNQDIVDNEMLQYFGAGNERRLMQTDADLEGVCRICLGEEDEPESNPLFSPCKCAGSMGLIHLECLREWLMSKKI